MMLQESGEMYLETILILSKKKNYVRSIDVGAEMNVSRPSVSRAVHLLEEGGFLQVEESGALQLTEAGREVAEKIYERHTVMTACLTALGVDAKTAANDACRIEHIISDETFTAIKKHMEDAGARNMPRSV